MRTPKFGAKLRNLYDAATKSKNDRYVCPKCGKKNVKRIGNALWQCKSCNAKIAGGAYSLSTGIGVIVNRIIREYPQS